MVAATWRMCKRVTAHVHMSHGTHVQGSSPTVENGGRFDMVAATWRMYKRVTAQVNMSLDTHLQGSCPAVEDGERFDMVAARKEDMALCVH